MTTTLNDLYEKLRYIDEISILEILDITTEEILNRFQDKVEEKYEELRTEFDYEEDLDY